MCNVYVHACACVFVQRISDATYIVIANIVYIKLIGGTVPTKSGEA